MGRATSTRINFRPRGNTYHAWLADRIPHSHIMLHCACVYKQCFWKPHGLPYHIFAIQQSVRVTYDMYTAYRYLFYLFYFDLFIHLLLFISISRFTSMDSCIYIYMYSIRSIHTYTYIIYGASCSHPSRLQQNLGCSVRATWWLLVWLLARA